MGNYYYVAMKNKMTYNNDGKWEKTETAKEIKELAGACSLGYSEPCALAILGIKCKYGTKKRIGHSGIAHNVSYIEDDPVFVICEDKEEYLEEVVTGNKYEKSKDCCTYEYSDKLKLSIVREIPASKVAEMLRKLSENQISSYANKIHELDNAIAIGYQKDMQRKKQYEIQKEVNDSYIKSFREKYGK